MLGGELGIAPGELVGVLAGLDRYEKSPEAAAEAVGAALGGDGPRTGRVMALAAGLGAPDALLGRPSAAPLRECLDALRAMGLGAFVDVDFRIVRGLAYYTGVVFELFDAGKSLRAICGGGRYDALLAQVSGVDLPMVGFGMGDVVLGELLQDRDGPPVAPPVVQVFLVTVGDDDRAAALGLAHALRERGIGVEYAMKRVAMGKQLELAAARGASHAVVIGPDERAAGTAVVRSLADKTETRVAFDALARDHAF
jgi:histidyl-tRNA synthetase